jgi:hypothetical protein
MLAERHAADTDPGTVATAMEWCAAHWAADAAEEQRREIIEATSRRRATTPRGPPATRLRTTSSKLA